DAFIETVAQGLQLRVALVDAALPGLRQLRPVRRGRHFVARQLAQLARDVLQTQSDSLCENDESDPAQRRARIAPMPGRIALGVNEPHLLVEAQRRGGNAAALGKLADRELLVHAIPAPRGTPKVIPGVLTSSAL